MVLNWRRQGKLKQAYLSRPTTGAAWPQLQKLTPSETLQFVLSRTAIYAAALKRALAGTRLPSMPANQQRQQTRCAVQCSPIYQVRVVSALAPPGLSRNASAPAHSHTPGRSQRHPPAPRGPPSHPRPAGTRPWVVVLSVLRRRARSRGPAQPRGRRCHG
eukprot:1161463-Pelagomonas_calceolata.AAC.6